MEMYIQTLLSAFLLLFIGFGFYYFGQKGWKENDSGEDNEWEKSPEITRAVGLAFIAIGFVVLGILAWKYMRQG